MKVLGWFLAALVTSVRAFAPFHSPSLSSLTTVPQTRRLTPLYSTTDDARIKPTTQKDKTDVVSHHKDPTPKRNQPVSTPDGAHHEKQQHSFQSDIVIKFTKDTDNRNGGRQDTAMAKNGRTTLGTIGFRNGSTTPTTRTVPDPFAVVKSREETQQDEALKFLSSELGVRIALGREIEPSFPLGLIYERALDTVEDVVLHLRRIPYDFGWRDETEADRQTIVILGSGWAAHALMKVADSFHFRVIVVSPSNHFVFTPMLASAAVGTVEYRSMTEAVRAANPMIEEYVEGSAVDVDLESQVVRVQLNSLLEGMKEGEPPLVDIQYDKLVVAVGAKVADDNVPGAKEHCLRLKTTEDARRLRVCLGECFEYASRPDVRGTSEEAKLERQRRLTFLIVGGGPTGVELAGELCDFAEDITRPRVGAYPRLKDSVRVILVHGGKDLLPQFEEELRKEALKTLEKQGIEVVLNTRVKEVKENSVVLNVKQFDEHGEMIGMKEEELQVGMTVFCAGTQPVPFMDTLLSKLPEGARGWGGKINVDRWMRPQTGNPDTFGSILVLGDAANFKESQYHDDSFLPQTAQVAGQQGAYVARLLGRGYDLSVTPPLLPCHPKYRLQKDDLKNVDCSQLRWLSARGLEEAPGFQFLNLGLLAYLGKGEALTQVQLGDVNVFSYAGSVAFVLWRSVYLVKQVASRNRILITFDWIKSALFGRDVTRL